MTDTTRLAVVLRGSTGAGKTTIASLVAQRWSQQKRDSVIVSLDQGWSAGEIRRQAKTPAERYADVVGRPESLLVLDLGWGEPDDGQHGDSTPGATRKPREWADLVAKERAIVAVRLSVAWADVENRLLVRDGRPPLPGHRVHYERIENDSERIGFEKRSGLQERVVKTDGRGPEDVADEIVKVLLGMLGTTVVRQPARPAPERLRFRLERQSNPIADDVSALIAVVRPILLGTLYALKQDVVAEVGGYDNVKMKMLPRLHRAGDGDCGICFEYAVHDAIERGDPMVMERVADVLSKHCRVPGHAISSILFGVEKAGNRQLIKTVSDILTEDSVLLSGTQGQPVKLKRHLRTVAEAFRRSGVRPQLPQSISGLWKADLFLGKSDSDKWVGTTVKINADHLQGAKGLRVGIVPAKHGRSDKPWVDEARNLVVCPLLHDASFMECFYAGWGVVIQFLAADARVPPEVSLPHSAERHVAKLLADRREFAVTEVVQVLAHLAQPELLVTQEKASPNTEATQVGAVVAPIAREVTSAE